MNAYVPPQRGWLRVRFRTDADGCPAMPVSWPPPGPYWCTGHGEDDSILVAYVRDEQQISEFWPEATDVDVHEENAEIRFTDRFPCPYWWPDSWGQPLAVGPFSPEAHRAAVTAPYQMSEPTGPDDNRGPSPSA